MKRLILSAIFAVVAVIGNTQVVTVSGFGTLITYGSVTATNTITDILLDKSSYLPSEDFPVGYKYVIDFDNLECTLYDGNGELVVVVVFKVVDKKSDRDFQIEFTDNDFEDDYGIIVKDTVAAHTQFNGNAVYLTVFDAMYIF
jgi:hypothetical protein